jgi:hypothetical protein
MSNLANIAPRQKVPPYVSQKLRQFARGQECTLKIDGICNHNPETTVLAHLRMFGWAGVAEKPHDFLAVHACSSCHEILDRRGTRIAVEPWEVLRALGETQRRVYAHFATVTP